VDRGIEYNASPTLANVGELVPPVLWILVGICNVWAARIEYLDEDVVTKLDGCAACSRSCLPWLVILVGDEGSQEAKKKQTCVGS
jgi:hypothetical protein